MGDIAAMQDNLKKKFFEEKIGKEVEFTSGGQNCKGTVSKVDDQQVTLSRGQIDNVSFQVATSFQFSDIPELNFGN